MDEPSTSEVKHATPRPAQSAARARSAQFAASTLVVPARYVLLKLAEVLTGYTVKAMQRKIERGDWIEGKVWRRAPDGHIVLDLQGYERWVEKQN